MAVQKNRKTRSRRGMRRSHDSLSAAETSVDQMTGEPHLRHNVAADGYYKGEEILVKPEKASEDEE